MNPPSLKSYKYSGARSLVLLHEHHLQSFLKVWREAIKTKIDLPATDDEDYQNPETLLRHVLRSACGYMTWICEQLQLPDPEIMLPPKTNRIEHRADAYVAHLLEKWRVPLADVDPEKFSNRTYPFHWGVSCSIEAMLEHAVMHPIRHEFQLRNLIHSRR